MNKKISLIMILALLVALGGCNKKDGSVEVVIDSEKGTVVEVNKQPQDESDAEEKYEHLARLYIELLWRDLTPYDSETLSVCSEELFGKLVEYADTTSSLRRTNEYYTVEEAKVVTGYYDSIGASIEPEQGGAWDESGEGEEFEQTPLWQKDIYPVTRISETRGYIELDDGCVFYVNLVDDSEKFYSVELVDATKTSRIFTVIVDTKPAQIIMDIDKGIVTRIRDNIS